MSEKASPDLLPLSGGQLIARPGPDLYLYIFKLPGALSLSPGSKGVFHFHACGTFCAAQVVDLCGPQLTLLLGVDKTPPTTLAGHFEASPPASLSTPPASQSTSLTELSPELLLFLDPSEGWAFSATEAASAKEAVYDASSWPEIKLAELFDISQTSRPNFLWTFGRIEAISEVAESLRALPGSLLILGSLKDLERLAHFTEAVYSGATPQSSPLANLSHYYRLAQKAEERDRELADLRSKLQTQKIEEAGLKAALSQWDDLKDLEMRLAALGAIAEKSRHARRKAQEKLSQLDAQWQTAELDSIPQGFLGYFKRNQNKNKKKADELQVALNEAEGVFARLRQDEEGILKEAERLSERLEQDRVASGAWSTPEALLASLQLLSERQREIEENIAEALGRPSFTESELLAEAEIVLALPGSAEELLAGRDFDYLLVLATTPPDHRGRQELTKLALKAKKKMMVLGDFTFWPIWSGRPGPKAVSQGLKGWDNFRLADFKDPFKEFIAQGKLFTTEQFPPGAPLFSRLELGQQNLEEALSFDYIVPPSLPLEPEDSELGSEGKIAQLPQGKPAKKRSKLNFGDDGASAVGLGVRALGELGPANPVSALMVAEAALNFCRSHSTPGLAALILSSSPTQSKLVQAALKDLNAPPERIYCGLPEDFVAWDPVPRVFLEAAFEAPHRGHPWAWPSYGRWRLALAWHLATEEVSLIGRHQWMEKLAPASPLASLWQRSSEGNSLFAHGTSLKQTQTFWETLDSAKEDIWLFAPSFAPFWWRPLAEHFLAAANRKVKVTIISQAPKADDENRDYAAQVFKILATYGCGVHLASGFPGFLALVDNTHFTWGHLKQGEAGIHIWGGLKTLVLPQTGPYIRDALQIDLIKAKLSRTGGGLKNCRHCGWPLVLVNQEQSLGYGDQQALKVDCLGACRSRRLVRIEEADAFAPPSLANRKK